MTRYADPERCPDCLRPMPYGADRCPSCGLSLEGPLAAQLFSTLSTADRLLSVLREQTPVPATTAPAKVAAAAAAGAPAGASVDVGAGPTAAPTPPPAAPAAPAAPPGMPPGALSGASVPKILLGLGALCLLVAALVFLAVTWSAMGVAGRTASLLGFTVLAGGLSAWAARRDLRAAAESLSVVAFGLLVFDMVGARSADWLGDVSVSGFLMELGAVLALLGAAAAVWVRRTPVRVLRGAEVFATVGLACLAAGTLTVEQLSFSVASTLVVPLLAGAALAARAARLTVTSVGAAALGTVSWLLLALSSWDRATANPTLGELWAELEVWPLLATAAFVGVLALVRRLPTGVRVGALAVAVLVLCGVVLAPLTDEAATDLQAAGAALVLVVSVGGWFAAQPWRRGLGAVAGLGLLWTGISAAVLAVEALDRIPAAATPPWSGTAGDSFSARVVTTADLASWLLPVLVVATTAAMIAMARSFGWADRVVAPLLDVYVVAAAAAATLALTLTLYPVPVWLVTGVFLLTGAGLVLASLRRRHALPLSLGAVFLAVALVLGLHDSWLTLLAAAALLVLATLVHLRTDVLEVSVGAGALAAGAAAGVVWTVGMLAAAAAEWTALAALLVLAALVLGSPYVDERIRLSGPATYARLGTETGALVSAAVVSLAAVDLVAPASRATWAAVYLTVMGATGSAMALLRGDRRLVGWLGGLLLAAASWVRLADLGVEEPEAYTLPSAVALLVVGLVYLRRHPDAGTMAALTPGLLLALVPSLLWVLAEPVTVRSVLLGVACLVLLLGGAHVRWSAPVVYGAVVGAALALRYVIPVVEGVPQWVLIGTAGVLLVAVGITWEQRVRDARKVAGYVRGLR